MDLVIVGLGRMGANMARRLHRAGHHVVAFNRSPDKTHEIMAEGLDGAFTPEEAVARLPAPRIVWLMVPAGDATEATMEEFAALLQPGDTIVDGGNSQLQGLQAPPRAARRAGHPLRGRGHLRWRLGAHERLRHDGRRGPRGGRAARADLPLAGAGGRLHPCRAAGRRALSRRWSTTASSTA